jgi:hypothetical protein
LKEDKTFLTVLDLSDCDLGATTAKQVFSAIKNTITLKEVYLRNIMIQEYMNEMYESLVRHKSL